MYENDNGMPDETKPAHGRYGMPAGMWGAGICYQLQERAESPEFNR